MKEVIALEFKCLQFESKLACYSITIRFKIVFIIIKLQ